MKKFQIIILFFLISVLTSCAALLDMEGGTNKIYQSDMDIARLNDLKTIGALIEEYRIKKGNYPFEYLSSYPVYVKIATKGQQKYAAQDNPPYKIEDVPVTRFIKELESVLNRKIELPFDPQKVLINKPNFYVYMIHKGIYYLAVHVHNKYDFSRNIASYYNKVEVSNVANPRRNVWIYKELMEHQSFIQIISRTPAKPGYVEELRRKMREEGEIF